MNKILLINISGIGDIISSLIVGNAFLDQYQVCYLIPKSFEGLLKDTPYIEYTNKSTIQDDFEIIIDLTSNNDSRKLIKSLKSSKKIGRYKNLSQRIRFFFLYNKMVPKFPTKEPHITWDYLPILNLLKLDPQNHISLQTKLTPKNSYISIHVGADKKIRRIPPKLVIEIINYLKAKNQKVRIIGIEKEEVKEILDGTNHYPLYESGNLEDVKRWLCESSLTIASDSGLFHLSAALGKPTIGLYGPNLYSRSGSINENAVSIELDYICRPCNQNIGCPFNNRCMNDITLKQVVEKISKFNLF